MSDTKVDVVGIGNAIVDVLSHCKEEDLTRLNLVKNAMTLIDAETADSLYAQMGPGLEMSGGSAGNTMAGIAALGGKGAYIGKVRNDQLGEVFSHDMRAIGVSFNSAPTTTGAPTARCLIFVTPDGHRTMNTFLGACTELGPDDIDADLITSAKIIYMEGYLWDRPDAKEAFIKAAKIAHEAGRQVSISLSDSFCVDRHRESFRDLVHNHIDVLFANEDEIKSLYEVDTFEKALAEVRNHCKVAALTRSEKGSVIVSDNEVITVDAEPVARVVDTTGAGDLFASGFLYGYTKGHDLATCGRLGSICAAEVISHMGARPDTDLKELVADTI
ncbi:adenosine kinase [Thalassospira alkalitolerans]|uniref:Carbohydrate kinase n=1 Tax=Thalassospira alkalitolerans TaxID=1293890 RepID=A0A1Y2LIP8_9PROT|nr:adenosine kinase [Thalassospira alkalitolerans]OSQ50114.1 carbohydrate kinase [Thalassospira alkalitolerans]|tara:strand:+ start:223213 stop:224202 length:990 start_codon:yes stop_codon:yes gene_type:complete